MGQDDNIKHAVSDTFIIIISERAPLEMAYISMSPKVFCKGAKRPRGDVAGGVPPPTAEKILDRRSLKGCGEGRGTEVIAN